MSHDGERKWKENISKKLRFVETIVIILIILIVVLLSFDIWIYHQYKQITTMNLKLERNDSNEAKISFTTSRSMEAVRLEETLPSIKNEKMESLTSINNKLPSPPRRNQPIKIISKSTIKENLYSADFLPLPKSVETQTSVEIESGTMNERYSFQRILQTHPFYEDFKPRHCAESPLLLSIGQENNFMYDERVDRILGIIQVLSSMDSLSDHNSPQYKAACWLLYDDECHMSADDEYLVQRYSLAVFLFAVNHDANIIPKDICQYEHISCNDMGEIIELNMGKSAMILPDAYAQGIIPSELAHIRSLESITLTEFKLEGSLPPELGRLRNLKVLDLCKNNLTGEIPTEFGGLSILRELVMNSNSLFGMIPKELGMLNLLEKMDIAKNNLSGCIPSEMFQHPHLVHLDLQNNYLTGSLPSTVNQLRSIKSFLLDNNNLNGTIPSEMGSLSTLMVLKLGSNKFSGRIPEEIANMESLHILIIEKNCLTGPIPSALVNIKNIHVINLSSNSLSGAIVPSFWDINFTFALIMEDVDLTGNVPDFFCSTLQTTHFKVDHSPWFLDEPKIKCDCCSKRNCHLWSDEHETVAGTVRPACPINNLYSIEFNTDYWAKDNIVNETLYDNAAMDLDVLATRNLCLSPSGCYSIYDDIEESPKYNFGYSASSKSLVKEDLCDTVNVCGVMIDAYHPKRAALNHLTKLAIPDLSILDNPSLPEYKSLCWIMTEDDLFDEFDICDGTLLQRYVMALFYNTYENFNFIDFSFNHTCAWPNITCDANDRFVEKMNFSQHNLKGTILTEIGLLTRLIEIDLSENSLSGHLDPSLYVYMPVLEVFNIGENDLKGEIPIGLMSLPRLRSVTLSENSLFGMLPTGTAYSANIEQIYFGGNQLHGSIPQELIACTRIEVVDLSRNGFSNTIPSLFGQFENLRELYLNGNRLSGSIPLSIFNVSQIEVLMLQSNMLTGIIPAEIGTSSFLRNISLSHNMLGGKIPREMQNLKNLEFLHLHFNMLTDIAPKINFQKRVDETFIADCGDPYFALPAKLTCESCTMCCNSMNKCQLYTKWGISFELAGIIITVLTPIGILLIFYVLSKAQKNGYVTRFQDKRHITAICNEDSVNCLIFSNNLLAWSVYGFTTIIQLMSFGTFLQKANFDNEDTDWSFTIRCTGNTSECEDEKSTSLVGWSIFLIVTFCYLGADVIDSFFQLRKAVLSLCFKMLLSGFIRFFLTAFAMFTSIVYNLALAESDTDLIMNAVILLFISDLDEQFLDVLSSLAPGWIENRYNEIEKFMADNEQGVDRIFSRRSSSNLPP